MDLSDLHLFSMNWCRRQDFPVPAFPITRNLKRKSAKGKARTHITSVGLLLSDYMKLVAIDGS